MAKILTHATPNPATKEHFDEIMLVVEDWTRVTRSRLEQSASQFQKGKTQHVKTWVMRSGKSKTEYKLKSKLNHRIRQWSGTVDSIVFTIQRHGVYVQKGVGRGYKMVGGKVVRYSKAKVQSSYSRKLGKTVFKIPVRRFPVDWFNKIINDRSPELANRVANIHADQVVNVARARIV